jgi:hypothetical protein
MQTYNFIESFFAKNLSNQGICIFSNPDIYTLKYVITSPGWFNLYKKYRPYVG